MDLMYLEAPPGLQILHCLENTVNGGTSLFMDIQNAVKELRSGHPKEFKILCSVPVLFHYMNDGKHYEFTRPTIKVGIDGNCSCYYSPPFQGPLNCSPKDLDGFYSAFSLFETLIKNEKYLLKHLLKPGEAVLFANQRVLHGREGFDPSSGKRWLKGTYVAWDEIQNNFRTNIQSKP